MTDPSRSPVPTSFICIRTMDTSFSGISCRDTIVTSRHHNLLVDNDLSPLKKKRKKKNNFAENISWSIVKTINSWILRHGLLMAKGSSFCPSDLDFMQVPSRFNIMRPSFGYVYTSKIVPGGGLASFCMPGFHVLIYKGSIWDSSFYV